jgi:hypothetical protein
MPILTSKGELRQANQCYLADRFDPTFPLQGQIGDSSCFTGVDYFQERDDRRVWKKLFLNLKVIDQIPVNDPIDCQISKLKKEHNVSYLDAYLSFLYQDKVTTPMKNQGENGTHTLVNFLFLPFMELLHYPVYAYHFWREITRNWDTVHRKCRDPKYKLARDERGLRLSYLQFCVGQMPICSTDHEPKPGRELYAPKLKELVGEYFPTVDTGCDLTDEQTQFFGFKTVVDPFHCLEIFEKMCHTANTSIPHYSQLLEHLVDGFCNLVEREQERFRSQPKFLIAENGKWQPCSSSLKCLLHEEATQRYDRADRVKKVLSPEKMERLSKLMGFKLISLDASEVEIVNAKEEVSILTDLRSKLPLIALCESQELGNKAPLNILRELAAKARTLKIYFATRIQLSLELEDTTDIYLKGQEIYFQKSCDKKTVVGKKLCEYFALSPGMGTLMPQILRLKAAGVAERSKGIPDFLMERGISSSVHKELESNYSHKECRVLVEEEDDEISAEEAEDVMEIESDEKIPMPTLPIVEIKGSSEVTASQLIQKEASYAPDQIDYRTLTLHRLKPTRKREEKEKLDDGIETKERDRKPAERKMPVRDEEETKVVGRWGEECIYRYLIHRYENHHSATHKTKLFFLRKEEIEQGVHIFCKDEKGDEVKIRIVWLNRDKETDSFQQRDLDLTWIKADQIIKRRWIEIKTSKGSGVHFFLSGKEWGFMNAHLNDFRIYHVANAGTEHPKITKIKSLFSSGLRALNTTEFVGTS